MSRFVELAPPSYISGHFSFSNSQQLESGVAPVFFLRRAPRSHHCSATFGDHSSMLDHRCISWLSLYSRRRPDVQHLAGSKEIACSDLGDTSGMIWEPIIQSLKIPAVLNICWRGYSKCTACGHAKLALELGCIQGSWAAGCPHVAHVAHAAHGPPATHATHSPHASHAAHASSICM